MTTPPTAIPVVGARAPKMQLLPYPLAEYAKKFENTALSRQLVHSLLKAGSVNTQAAEEIVARLDDLQGLLAGLAPNSLPDDHEVCFYLRLRDPQWATVTCHFRAPMPSLESNLTIELHEGWAWRVQSLTASRVFERVQPIPERTPR